MLIQGGGDQKFSKMVALQTSKSQNGSITETRICPKRPFSRIFRGTFGTATNFAFLLHFSPIFSKLVALQRFKNRKLVVGHSDVESRNFFVIPIPIPQFVIPSPIPIPPSKIFVIPIPAPPSKIVVIPTP